MDTTTTTTSKPETTTTTTTTEKPQDTTTTTTLKPYNEASPNAERQGEVVADKDADTPIVGQESQTHEDRLDAARREGLSNHDSDHSNDDKAKAKADGRL